MAAWFSRGAGRADHCSPMSGEADTRRVVAESVMAESVRFSRIVYAVQVALGFIVGAWAPGLAAQSAGAILIMGASIEARARRRDRMIRDVRALGLEPILGVNRRVQLVVISLSSLMTMLVPALLLVPSRRLGFVGATSAFGFWLEGHVIYRLALRAEQSRLGVTPEGGDRHSG